MAERTSPINWAGWDGWGCRFLVALKLFFAGSCPLMYFSSLPARAGSSVALACSHVVCFWHRYILPHSRWVCARPVVSGTMLVIGERPIDDWKGLEFMFCYVRSHIFYFLQCCIWQFDDHRATTESLNWRCCYQSSSQSVSLKKMVWSCVWCLFLRSKGRGPNADGLMIDHISCG